MKFVKDKLNVQEHVCISIYYTYEAWFATQQTVGNCPLTRDNSRAGPGKFC